MEPEGPDYDEELCDGCGAMLLTDREIAEGLCDDCATD